MQGCGPPETESEFDTLALDNARSQRSTVSKTQKSKLNEDEGLKLVFLTTE